MEKQTVITTDVFNISVYDEGRRIVIETQPGVKVPVHNSQLLAYANKVYATGVERIKVDHIKYPYNDDSIRLMRGKRRLDMIYYKQGHIFEVEFKTDRECGLDITYRQIKEMAKDCTNLIMAVPQSQLTYVEDTIRNFNINNVSVEAWDR